MTVMTPLKVEQYRAYRRAGHLAIQAKHRAAAEARFEDLEFMLATGETVERAMQRLGTNRNAMHQSCKRYGRPDLIQMLKQGDR